VGADGDKITELKSRIVAFQNSTSVDRATDLDRAHAVRVWADHIRSIKGST
jgi:hypothetical protein